MSKNKPNDNTKPPLTPSAQAFDGTPEDSFDTVNKYGTYEIQPTSGMQNEFPQIAQGYTSEGRTKKKKQKKAKEITKQEES